MQFELDLANSSKSRVSSHVEQNSISVESQKLMEVLKRLDSFSKRMDSMETNLILIIGYQLFSTKLT